MGVIEQASVWQINETKERLEKARTDLGRRKKGEALAGQLKYGEIPNLRR